MVINFKGKEYSHTDYTDNQLEQIKLAIAEGFKPNEKVNPEMEIYELINWRQDERDKKTFS